MCFLGPTIYCYIARQLLRFFVYLRIQTVLVLLSPFTKTQNLRTVIVTADIHRDLGSKLRLAANLLP